MSDLNKAPAVPPFWADCLGPTPPWFYPLTLQSTASLWLQIGQMIYAKIMDAKSINDRIKAMTIQQGRTPEPTDEVPSADFLRFCELFGPQPTPDQGPK